MIAEDVFKLDGNFYGNHTIANIPCTVGYFKEFRWSWMATQLNTFVIVGETEQRIDVRTMDVFSALAFQFALNHNKGWPRGLQAGIASVAILKGNDIDPAAIGFVSNPSRKHWSAFEIPVIYNTSQRHAFRYTSNPIWGMIYMPYLGKLIDGVTAKL